MGNFNTPALLFGFILLVASIVLFLFGRFKPELQRDSDNIYAVVGIVCALILFGSAFSLSLGMSFQQLLMIGSLIALMWENIQNRQPKAPGSRRGSLDGIRDGMRDSMSPWGNSRGGRPSRDDDRAVSNAYMYDNRRDNYDRFDAPPPRPEQPRIRGSQPRPGYGDEFGGDSRRGPSQGGRGSRADEWDEPPRRSRGRGDGRGDGRGPQDNRRPPQDDMPPPRRRPPAGSMDGSPIPPGMRDDRPGSDFNDGPGQRGPGGRPPMERPPGDRPPAERPPAERPPMDAGQRPPMNRPPMDAGQRPPMDRAPGDRPPTDRPPMDRPPMDRPPMNRPPMERPPVNAGPASQAPPSRRPGNDDYVDFQPLTPPPDDEMDNSSQFDD